MSFKIFKKSSRVKIHIFTVKKLEEKGTLFLLVVLARIIFLEFKFIVTNKNVDICPFSRSNRPRMNVQG